MVSPMDDLQHLTVTTDQGLVAIVFRRNAWMRTWTVDITDELIRDGDQEAIVSALTQALGQMRSILLEGSENPL
jgi:hypothetical protein